MANHKSAKKAHIQSEKRRQANSSLMSRINTFIKKAKELMGCGAPAEAKVAMQKAESEIMKGASKGVMKKQTAARKVSRLAKEAKKVATGGATEKAASKKKKV